MRRATTKPATAKKGGTKSTKTHTFQSFTQKLHNLNIDPIRKVRHRVLDEGSESSFFHGALEKWVDLNLSTTFVELFVRPVRPLSESLPHILHHKERIFGLLVDGIKTRDVNALEPLLDLLTQFAHDLGVEFEGFFEESVGLLAGLVAEGFVEAQVVEWVFGALAYLLKYLSKLLVGDLRPLFGIVRGMLGRGGGRGFVRRCAGEAIGFLVRRVKVEVIRDLARAVFEDLRECEGAWVAEYMEGLMGLFREGCVGVDRRLHSKAPVVMESLVQVAKELGEDIGGRCFKIIEGVLISLVHHTNDETFRPALQVVYDINYSGDKLSTRMSSRLLYICLTVRKGSRIADWVTAGEVVSANVRTTMKLSGENNGGESVRETMWESLKAAAMVIQTADMEVVITLVGRIMDPAKEFQDGQLFLPFCEFLADTGAEKFRAFMLPYFQRFITAKWAIAEDSLLYLIPKLGANGSLVSSGGSDRTAMAGLWGDKSPVTTRAMDNIREFCKNIEGGGDRDTLRAQATKIWEYLDVILSLSDSIPGEQLPGGFVDALEQLLNDLFSLHKNAEFAALAGKVLTVSSKYPSMGLRNLEGPLAVAFPDLADNALFLKGVVDLFSLPMAKKLTDKALTSMADKLVTNLSSSSHAVRSHSLRCLELLHVAKNPQRQVSSVINTAQIIESTPLEISNARNISLYIRRLAGEYSSVAMGSWESSIVPYFCFGLLTVHFSPVWNDATAALSSVAERDEGAVAMLAFEWLERQRGPSPEASDSGKSESGRATLNGFECSNLNMAEGVADKCVMGGFKAAAALERKYAEDLKIPTLSASVARMQALKVLTEVPRIAEKRSRKLVPMFLEWSTFEDTEEDEEEAKSPTKWLRKEQSAMLTLFTKFTNTRSLYKSDAVYSALLSLLISGDPKIQTLVLKCIFTWRIPAIRTYEDNLNNLLDDTRFRDEITHFVQVDEDESVIQDDHREKLIPVLMRLLYGRSLSRKNATSGKKGMESRRIVILASLASFQQWERELFIDIALGNLAEVSGRFVEKSSEKYILHMEALGTAHVSNRKQMGFVRMTEDMIRQLGSTLLPFLEKIVDAFLYCLIMATKTIDSREDNMGERGDVVAVKAARAIRQGGIKCLGALFNSCPAFSWVHYMPAIFDELINPRLDALPMETSQGPSGLLQLFSTWANSRDTVMFLADYNPTVLSKVAACLANKSVKDEVVLFVIRMVKQIVSLLDSEGGVGPRLLEPNVDVLLVNLGGILRKSPSKEVLEQAVEAVSGIAPFVSGDMETTHLVEISVFLLGQPSRRVSPKAKSDILKILLHFLPLCIMEKGSKLYEDTFQCVSSLFGFFKDREGRETLAGVLNVFAERDEDLIQVAELSRQLNSFSDRRLDEPDFEQRLGAYGKINEDLYLQFSPKQWMPLIFNMLFFIRDNEELAIRTSASYALKRFAESCGQKSEAGEREAYLKILSETLMPALKRGAREQSELVRMEYVAVVAHIVKECSFWEEARDMKALLVGDDEEANFFNNILHIQQHRRLRALRRLAITSRRESIQSSNIAHFFLPLVEHFIFDQTEDAHNLASETVVTIGALAEQLTWTQYRALFRRYTGYLKSKPELEKIVVRLIGTAVDSLARAAVAKEDAAVAVAAKDGDGDVPMGNTVSRLAESLPEQQTLAEDICKGFLSPLSEYLHQKEESTVSLRVPIAVSIAKLLKLMPDDMLRLRLPPVLTDVCHILRSRSQESRDMTRKTLTEITTLLGPQYFEFVLKELRGALLRGYQLHVLSFTMHSILVSVAPTYPPGALDYCVAEMVSVVMDDIFGVTGMEKDAEGYISKMREVKSSKSYDSMDLMASMTTLPYLGGLIRPIGALLKENMNLRMLQKIDELLRRITVGLLRNKEIGSEKILIFCYEVIQEGYKQDSAEPREKEFDPKTQRYLVNLKVPSKTTSGVTTSSHMYKLTRFALDLLRTTLQKHDSLMTPRNLANFIPVIGDALLSKHEEIQISALRVLTTIIRTPLPAIDKGAEVFMGQALSFIKSCPTMNAELAQASLKLMSSVLRERRNVKIKERTIGYLLTRLKPDLEEPDRQGVTFNFLKAVIARKVVIPEVYDVLDSVAAIMVTNQTRSVRDLARGVYFQFLMEYPQGRDRFSKQLAFLVKNLDYVHQSGRHSVLEAANLLCTKVGDNFIQQILGTFFVPLVMRLINDDSPECREMTGALLGKVLERADTDNISTFTGMMKNWLDQDQKPLLVRSALQIYGLYLDVSPTSAKKDLPFVMGKLQSIIRTSSTDQDAHWENLYFSLQTWAKIVLLFPTTAFSADQAPVWACARDCLSFPHAWVRLSAARLTGLLFAEYAAKTTLSAIPLDNGAGLTLSAEAMIHTARRTSSHLNSPELSEELGLQVVKNLLFLARCFHAAGVEAISSVPVNDPELDDVEEEAQQEDERKRRSALEWLAQRISAILRSERNIKKGLLGKRFAMQWIAALILFLPKEDLEPLAKMLIRPLYNVLEVSGMHLMKDLKPTAQEVQSSIAEKLGTTLFAVIYSQVKSEALDRRRIRKGKRAILAVVDPEKAAAKKIRKHERKKEVRKEKGRTQREGRWGRRG